MRYMAARSVVGTAHPVSILLATPDPSLYMIWQLVSAASHPMPAILTSDDGCTSVGAAVELARPAKKRWVAVATPVAGPAMSVTRNPPYPAARLRV